MLEGDDVEVAGGTGENVDLADDLLHGHNLEAFHAGLQCADGVDLSDEHSGAGATHGEGAALADVAVAADQSSLATDHHVSSPHNAVGEGVAASIDVVELGFGHAVVHVDGREQELALGGHLLQSVHTGGGLLADTLALRRHAAVLGLVRRNGVLQELEDALELGVVGAVGVGQRAVLGVLLLELLALVNQESGITTVVHQLVAAIGARHSEHLLGAPPVLGEGLALPSEHSRCAGLRDRGSSMILSGEDVAASPPHLGTEGMQGLDEDTSLDGHVEATADVQTLEGLRGAVLLSCVHQAWHLVLGQGQLLAAELGQAHVLNLGVRHGD
mmetsp:Transcript_78307/g.171637  ORF Transcript_78307/g.171637 Transcript_78307/m.171637 type:complete len:329 (+) Transcript_78307:827-1813(+)